jgi:hypothetical protein
MATATSTLKERQEWAQPALVLGSAAFAYLVPFEGLLYAYAILGPAHYLTQLNWLHDRGYFIADRAARWLFLGLGAAGLALILFMPRLFGSYGPAYALVMVAMSTLLLTRLPVWAIAAASAAIALAAWWGSADPRLIVVFGVLLPTVIHVGLFTLLFLLRGAQKRGDVAGKVSVVFWLCCAGVLLILPPEVRLLSPAWFESQRGFTFDIVAIQLGAVPGEALGRGWATAYGLLTFAYTYHYLNWFSKTELLQWHRIARVRVYPMIAIYLGALALYAYDYWLGFFVLQFLAFLHVIAEFPLDLKVIQGVLMARAEARSGA